MYIRKAAADKAKDSKEQSPRTQAEQDDMRLKREQEVALANRRALSVYSEHTDAPRDAEGNIVTDYIATRSNQKQAEKEEREAIKFRDGQMNAYFELLKREQKEVYNQIPIDNVDERIKYLRVTVLDNNLTSEEREKYNSIEDPNQKSEFENRLLQKKVPSIRPPGPPGGMMTGPAVGITPEQLAERLANLSSTRSMSELRARSAETGGRKSRRHHRHHRRKTHKHKRGKKTHKHKHNKSSRKRHKSRKHRTH